jgi:uncharacterized damage-inducible protein DinB
VSVTTREIVDFSDYVASRTHERLIGLTDDEYLWEPVQGCLAVRLTDAGAWAADPPASPAEPQPFTTLGWRLWHLTTCYCSDRTADLLGVDSDRALTDADPAPASAADALAALEHAQLWWRHRVSTFAENRWREPLDPSAGAYADNSKASFVLHMLDEQIHHGAEVAVIRDLYAHS